MATKSKYVVVLDCIQSKVHDFLKTRGFRKKGRTFNREADESGIFQVIHFQSGPFPIGENYELPGFRENLYGRFAINLGVLVRELYDLEEWHKPTSFYQEVYCDARTRLETLLGKKDFSWDLTRDIDLTADEIVLGLNSAGFDYFNLYSTRDKFIQNFGKYGDAPPRAPLDVAFVVWNRDRVTGEKMLQEYFHKIENQRHKEYVANLFNRLSIQVD